MKRFILLTMLASLLLTMSYANTSENNAEFTQTIRGKVYDKITEIPLPGATVILPGTEPLIGTTTDINGEFELPNIPVGRVDVKISFVGYHDRYFSQVSLITGKELVLQVAMEEQVIQGEEIIIKANARKDQAINKMATVSARSFTIEETERFAGSLGDPSRMVSNYAGVLSVSDQRNDIIIRGNSSTGLAWRLDGFEIPNPNHFGSLGATGGPVSMLNNNQLANSDFFTGAFPAEYGNAVAGAFDLKMRNGNSHTREHVFQIGFNGFELGTEGPFKKGGQASYMINYRYSTLAVFDMMGIDPGTGSSIPQYQDLSFKINVPNTKLGNFQMFGIGGLSYIEFDSREKDSTEWTYGLDNTYSRFGSDMGVVGISNKFYFDNNTRLETRVSMQAYRYTGKIDSVLVNESLDPFYRNTFSEQKMQYSLTFKKKFGSKDNLQIGVVFDDGSVSYVDSAFASDYNKFITRVNINDEFNFMRSYIQHQHKFNDVISLTGGLHFQYLPLNGSNAIEPRLGVKYQLDPRQSLNFGYGLHSQTQTKNVYFLETYLEDSDSYIKTNEDLDFTRSQHVVVGYDRLFADNVRIKVETYFQNLWDVPVTETRPEFSMLNFGDFFAIPLVDSLSNAGTGKNYGLEFTLEKFLSNNYYYLLTASLFESKYKGTDNIERNSAYNGNYAFNALAGYELKINDKLAMTFNLKGVYAGGKRKLPIDLAESRAENESIIDWENAYKDKYSDYYKLDLRISLKVSNAKINQEWALDIGNFTNNTKNVLNEYYDTDSQTIKTEYQSGIFPMFLYRLYF